MAGTARRRGEGRDPRPARVVPAIEVEVRGEMPPDSAEYARTMVLAVAGHAREPVLSARVRLTQGRDPKAGRSVVARATMNVNGRPARARVAAETMHEAVDLLRNRLDYRLARLEHWRLWPGAMSDPYELWPGQPKPWHRGREPVAGPWLRGQGQFGPGTEEGRE